MSPIELKTAYTEGQNITSLLRHHWQQNHNTEPIIEQAYDLQSSTYVRSLDAEDMRHLKNNFGNAIAAEITRYTSPSSLLEAGVGEGTTLSFVAQALARQPDHLHGFDLCWSRIACARQWLEHSHIQPVYLTVASLLHIPYQPDSFDVVYTAHSIEPNGGQEIPILQELHRITSRYLILIEPAFEMADPAARARMTQLGYCTRLREHAENLGMNVIKHESFPFSVNPLNPAAILVIAKDADARDAVPDLACPLHCTRLHDHGDSLYSPASFRAYPKIQGIPCLRPEDGILASAYPNVIGTRWSHWGSP